MNAKTTSGSLKLQLNRLSGDLPETPWENYASVDILSGTLIFISLALGTIIQLISHLRLFLIDFI